MDKDSALLVVDMQNDFCPDGALAVKEGDLVVPVLNRYIELFTAQGLPVFFTRDWHPVETSHFQAFGGVWPVHCVQGTRGADFHPDLILPPHAVIISKGMDPSRDDYSALHGAGPDGTPLPVLLRQRGVRKVYVGGLATDYCVKESVLEGIAQGFTMVYLADACRGVNLQPEDTGKAEAEMARAGAGRASLAELTAKG
ncbi:MAG: bifunctional nicotinamidase/pyrazinamidase [Geobacter sp.]|nr:MAG: bifunctional nicotinamidase/pyrazinamidase [Geobacter sp.]